MLSIIGLLTHSTEGNRISSRLNPDFPLLAELKTLFRTAIGSEQAAPARQLPPEPSEVRQPFPWMETLSVPSLPAALRRIQVDGEWDRAY